MEDMFPIILIAAVVIIGVDVIVAQMMQDVAALKGYGKEVHAFAMCFWLGIIGYIYVAALPDKIQQEQNQKIIELMSIKNSDNHEEM